MKRVFIHGAGPAGSMAALSALNTGAQVTSFDKSRFPRHKVCGEFLSPETARVLDRAGLTDSFLALQPARISHLAVQLGKRRIEDQLPEPAFGLSRHALDLLLWQTAISRGACFERQTAPETPPPIVMAVGRHTEEAGEKSNRLFGFKAHFSGPIGNAVELYFFDRCYVGINSIENGMTNVCGLAPQALLKAYRFDIARLFSRSSALTERLRPLEQAFDWLSVGPLVFGNRLRDVGREGIYPAGDHLSFVDPFTGSGLLSAMLTGQLAGKAAAEALPVSLYLKQCERALLKPYRFSSAIRWLVREGWAESLGQLVPGKILFQLTRPHLD